MKKYCLTSFIVICLLSAADKLCAQDPHFSQYFSSPLTVNPALTGKGVAVWRVAATFRSQWWGGTTAPFTTTAGSIEKSYYTGTTGNSNLAIGLSFLTDASNSGLLKNNYFTGSVAYNIDMAGDGKQLLGLGLGASYANRLLDAGKFEFQSQFGSMGFQRSISSGDPATILSGKYFDLNAGIHYSRSEERWGYGLGASVFHAGSPEESVYNNNVYHLARRFTFHGSLFLATLGKDEFHFGAITDIQAGNSIFTLGGMYKTKIHDETLESLNIGLYNRFGDAFFPYIGLESKTWSLGITYDIINSDVSNSYNSVQSLDFSFSLSFGRKAPRTDAVKMMY